MAKTDVFDVTQKLQKGPEPPTPILLTNKKLKGVDLRRKMQGLRNSHLLYGPSWWPKKRKVKNDKGLGGRASRRLPERQKLDLKRKCGKTIEFYCRKWKRGPFGVDETSATLTKYRK